MQYMTNLQNSSRTAVRYEGMRDRDEERVQLRVKKLESMIEKTEKELAKAPQGSLTVRQHKGHREYWHRQSGKRDVYLSKRNNTELLRVLAQKDYDRKVLKLMKQQKKEMEQHENQYFCGSLDEVFENLCEERRVWVTPVEMPTQQYTKIWMDMPYEKSSFPIDPEKPNYTDRGEAVRSKSEVLIANALYSAGIPYRYECPLKLGSTTIRPDFTILDLRDRKEVYFEHFGMMDDPEYLKGFMKKFSLYEMNGIFPGFRLICTFESSAQSLDTRILKKMIQVYLL